MSNSAPTTLSDAIAWSRIVATGSEAESFLQGQLTQDLAAIGDQGAWSLLLAPDSVVIASLYVTRVEGGLALVVEGELVEPALARLKRFLLRTDCRLELEHAVDGPFATLTDRIDGRWPGAGEFAGALTPHSFGPTFVCSTVSFTKGCFTGQELVGRLDARGSSVPWRLVHASGADAGPVNEALRSKGPPGPQGLTSWVVTPTGVSGLAIVHRTLLGEIDVLARGGVVIETID